MKSLHSVAILLGIMSWGICCQAQTTSSAESVSTETAVTAQLPAAADSTELQPMTTQGLSETTSTVQLEQITATSAAESTPTLSTVADAPTSVSLPEGVVYQIIKEGTGPVEQSTQTLLLHYTLYLTDGTRIESSRDPEFPVPLQLTRGESSFIKGVELGVAGMKVGEVRRMYIPAHLGYGEQGNGPIKPNTPLMFEVELVEAKNP